MRSSILLACHFCVVVAELKRVMFLRSAIDYKCRFCRFREGHGGVLTVSGMTVRGAHWRGPLN